MRERDIYIELTTTGHRLLWLVKKESRLSRYKSFGFVKLLCVLRKRQFCLYEKTSLTNYYFLFLFIRLFVKFKYVRVLSKLVRVREVTGVLSSVFSSSSSSCVVVVVGDGVCVYGYRNFFFVCGINMCLLPFVKEFLLTDVTLIDLVIYYHIFFWWRFLVMPCNFSSKT